MNPPGARWLQPKAGGMISSLQQAGAPGAGGVTRPAQANRSGPAGTASYRASAGEMRKLVERMSSAVPIVEELAKNNGNITEILSVIEGIPNRLTC